MKLSLKQIGYALATILIISTNFNVAQAAGNKKTYTEDQFLSSFSGKSKALITQKLGAPFKKDASVKPQGASSFLNRVGADEKGSKRVNVEMWYYKNLVKYDPTRTYKETEITFVNDKVMNIAFFNNR